MPVTESEFRSALRQFAAGVTVVTTRTPDGRPTGLTASAFTAVSLSPPLVLVCVDHVARAHDALAAHGWFAVNVLARGQEWLSRLFASQAEDKFTGLPYREGRAALPLLPDVLVALECRVVGIHAGGDHTIFVGQVEGAGVAPGAPLVYFDCAYRDLAPNGGPA
jgi:4-nitrophenol 2-monooxygenase / 4-nitrocatechol 4-monooxygenase, reductase component